MKLCPRCHRSYPEEWELPLVGDDSPVEKHMLKLRIICEYCHRDRFGIKRPTEDDRLFFEVHGTVTR
jgi:hypothetical protein